MSKLFANLDPQTIDEQIEQVLHTIPEQQHDQETCCLQDLQYLYRKEEILARAQQRILFPNEQAPATPGAERREAEYTAWLERNTILSQPYPTHKKQPWSKLAASLAAAILLIGAIIGTTWLFHAPLQPAPGSGHKSGHTTATPAGSIVFSDPLSQNIHQWPTGNDKAGNTYLFKDGAYHITNHFRGGGAAATIPQDFQQTNLIYQITMEQVSGDDTDPTNTFGIILSYNSQTTNGKTVTTFYTFEILNNNVHSEYRFYKYDSSQTLAWVPLWKAKPGQEFHQSQGPGAANTVKIVANGRSFTSFVNDHQVGTVEDNSFKSGQMGLIVNLRGTEVAFSNLLITQP